MDIPGPGEMPVILIVEDSIPDFESIIRAFERLNINDKIHRCETGDEALDFLYHRNKYRNPESSPRPDVILLDLNLPGTDGRDVLKEIKNDPDLKSIPVVVLTTSGSDKDIADCYRNGANSYLVKAVDWKVFFKAMENFKTYCLETAKLPSRNP